MSLVCQIAPIARQIRRRSQALSRIPRLGVPHRVQRIGGPARCFLSVRLSQIDCIARPRHHFIARSFFPIIRLPAPTVK